MQQAANEPSQPIPVQPGTDKSDSESSTSDGDDTPTPVDPQQQQGLIADIKAAVLTQPDMFSGRKDFEFVNGVYYKDERIVVPDDAGLRRRIIEECHSSLFAGHMGRDKTIELVSRLFWWPNLRDDVSTFVRCCQVPALPNG